VARDLPVPGRELNGIHQAMEYLPLANKVQQGDMQASPIDAKGKHVVIIGGGDTGADCLGTAIRQGAATITQLEIMPTPPDVRASNNPWPQWSLIYRTSSAHEEGGERVFSVNTERFVDDGNGNVKALVLNEVHMVEGKFEIVPGTTSEIPADLVFLALGFVGPDKGNWIERLGVKVDDRGNIAGNRSNRHIGKIPVGTTAATVINHNGAMSGSKELLDSRSPIISRHAPTVDKYHRQSGRTMVLKINAATIISFKISHKSSYAGGDRVTPGSGLKWCIFTLRCAIFQMPSRLSNLSK
jgi:NADPH-dependent glutamate synthase beta subunit-like oxidoreductase